MDQSNIDIDLFDKYLQEEMSATERQTFEDRLKAEPEFSKAFGNYQSSVEAVRMMEIREEMGQIIEQKSARSQPWHYVAAASLVFLLGISVLLLRSPSPDDLFEKYYEPYPVANFRGENTEDAARTAYRQGDYSKVIDLLNNYDQEAFDGNGELLLILGNSYLITSEFAQATEIFEQATHAETLITRQSGEWYLALTYLKSGKTDEAISVLKRMTESNHLYKTNAGKILENL